MTPTRYSLCSGFLLLTMAIPVPAQSTLTSTPNVATGWIAPRHGLLLDLVHRFAIGPAPSHRVTNASTLALSYGITSSVQAGITYGSASELVSEHPNEFELAGRVRLLHQRSGAPMDLLLHGAWNATVSSADAQLHLARRFGAGRVAGTVTMLGDAFKSGDRRVAIGGGAVIPLTRGIALAGDLTSLLSRHPGEQVTWSAGLQFEIIGTPHSLSIHASNVASRTLQGSLAASRTRRIGFEYTIPITVGARRAATDGDR